METGKIRLAAMVAVMGSVLASPASLHGQTEAELAEYEAYPLETRIWLDRGAEPVLRRGDRVRIYYRVSEDAYISIFHIDTNGTVRLAFPSAPGENHYARGGRDYRLLFPESSYWLVRDYPGMGYFFILASPIPFDFSKLRYSHYDGGWDLTQVGRQLYTDPYVAMDDYVAALIPEWEYTAYALDFTEYRVGEAYTYPRFLCYDCHGFRPYVSWNPYHYTCTSFRLMIWDDPYYYPYSRYYGTRVVYVQPPRRGEPRFVFKERADGESGSPLVRTRPGSTPLADRPGVAGDPAPRRTAPGGSNPATNTAVRRPTATNTAVRRPTAVIPDRAGSTGAAARRTSPTAERTSPTAGVRTRPVLERRPASTGTAGTTTRSTTQVKPKRTGGSGGNGGSAAAPRTNRPSSTATRSGTPVRRGTTLGSPTRGSAGTSGVRSSGSSGSTGTTVRSGGTTRSSTGTTRVRSGGSSGSTRTTVRSGGTTRSSTGTSGVRSSGSSGSTRTTVRSGGTTTRSSAGTARARSGGSSGTSRTTVRRGGGG